MKAAFILTVVLCVTAKAAAEEAIVLQSRADDMQPLEHTVQQLSDSLTALQAKVTAQETEIQQMKTAHDAQIQQLRGQLRKVCSVFVCV
jgi:predicted  nucleic acid-binding Zn-ribbon protein